MRLIRLIEYLGTREWVERQISKSIHGTRVVGGLGAVLPDLTITALDLMRFPEPAADGMFRFSRILAYSGKPEAVEQAMGHVVNYKKIPNGGEILATTLGVEADLLAAAYKAANGS